jgi:prepilin-type N-terminal cleavage/methylation domain-containing protein
MTPQRGFTIVEFMVAIVLLSLLLLSASSLFVYQSKSGREATQTVASSEGLSMAMGLITQDVMHAGYGLYNYTSALDKSSMSIFLDDLSAGNKSFQKMYINYGRYLTFPGVCTSTATFQPATAATTWTSALTPSDVGCLMAPPTSSPAVVNFSLSNKPTFNSATNQYNYTFEGSGQLAGTQSYAPGISYQLGRYYDGALAAAGDAKKPYNVLMRNALTTSGAPQILLGAMGDLRVTEFHVWAYFFDSSGNRAWSPKPIVDSNFNVLTTYQSDTATDAKTFGCSTCPPITDLRWLEIWIGYQFKQACASGDPTQDVNGNCWGATMYRKTRVSPRNLRLR